MTTHTTEDIEKVRQGIMRYRELLDIMRFRLEEAEKAYEGLFTKYVPDERDGMEIKKLQWLIAERIIDQPIDLTRAVMQIRFDARDLEKAFEELYDNLIPD